MEAGVTDCPECGRRFPVARDRMVEWKQSLGKATSSAAEDGITTGYYGMRTSDERFYTI